MAVLDEIAGGCLWVNGYKVVLARFESDLRAPVPLGRVILASGDIDRVDGRKIYATGVLRGDDGTTYVEARGLFVQLQPAQLDHFVSTGARLRGERVADGAPDREPGP